MCLILCQGSCWCSSVLQQIRGQLKRDFPPSRTKQGQLAWGQLVLVANVLKNLLHIIWNSFCVRMPLGFPRSSSNSKSNGSSWIRKWQVMQWHRLSWLQRSFFSSLLLIWKLIPLNIKIFNGWQLSEIWSPRPLFTEGELSITVWQL